MLARRKFLGLLGGAAVAGPSAAKSVASEMSMPSLSLASGMGRGGGNYSTGPISSTPDAEYRRSYAKDALTRLLGKTAAQIQRERRDHYIASLDPDVASLRAMALGSKIRLQKRISYERATAREEEEYRGILSGLWS